MVTTLATEPAFYADVYRTELEVWVDAVDTDATFGPYLSLSATLCHPHGGGQKGDRATLALPAEEAQVLGVPDGLAIVDTRKADGRILHRLAPDTDPARLEALLVGSHPYTLRLDWAFRRRQMRLHSAAHLLHCFIEQVLGAPLDFPETSDLQPEHGLNRYDRKAMLTPEQFAEALRRLNAFTAEGHAIATYPDETRPGFRFWRCEQWVIPCGGTHPANTSEIGPVQAELSLKRGKTGMTFRLDD